MGRYADFIENENEYQYYSISWKEEKMIYGLKNPHRKFQYSFLLERLAGRMEERQRKSREI